MHKQTVIFLERDFHTLREKSATYYTQNLNFEINIKIEFSTIKKDKNEKYP